MAIVSFSPEAERPPLDQSLEQVAEAATGRGKALRFRVQPELYDYEKQRYNAWQGLIWSVDLEDVEEGRLLREGLTSFFRLFGRSPESQAQLLKELEEQEALQA